MADDGEQARGEVTRLLASARDGDQAALDELIPLVYNELREMASRQLYRESAEHTLQATALVNEAYLKLAGQRGGAWQNRAHFLGIAARAMRQILIDRARRRLAEKRGGAWKRTTLANKELAADFSLEELLALDDALERLDERQRTVVEFKFFGGMTEQEIADVLKVSVRSVQRDWVKARAWLYRELYPEGGE